MLRSLIRMNADLKWAISFPYLLIVGWAQYIQKSHHSIASCAHTTPTFMFLYWKAHIIFCKQVKRGILHLFKWSECLIYDYVIVSFLPSCILYLMQIFVILTGWCSKEYRCASSWHLTMWKSSATHLQGKYFCTWFSSNTEWRTYIWYKWRTKWKLN